MSAPAGTLYLYPDKSAVFVPTAAISRDAVEHIQHAWDRWRATEGGVAVLQDEWTIVVMPAVERNVETGGQG